MNFVAMTLGLKAKENPAPLLTSAAHAHAAVLNAISAHNAALGRRLHDMQRSKWMTLAIVDGNRRDATLRLTFLTPEGVLCANALMAALFANPVLRVGNIRYEITAVNPNDSQWGGISTWSDFCVEPARRFMSFVFITPTAIRKKGDDGMPFASLYPDPLDVFSGLRRRWQALAGPALEDGLEEFIHAGGCVISSHNLRTVEFRMPEHTQIGFVGRATYECLRDAPECISALNALARFAFFAGVGYQTARGMGAVTTRVED